MGWPKDFVHKLLQMTHGRTTAFFACFFVAGNVLAWFGKLTPAYVGFMGTLGTLILGHSIKEDFMAGRNGPPPSAGGADVESTK